MGHSKVLYAEDDDGRFSPALSNGWEAEEIALDQAIEEFRRQAAEAFARACAGTGSPLEYHMYRARMDLQLLAHGTGYPRWRVRRHLRRGAFLKLPDRIRRRYAEALGKTPAQLDSLPDES